MRSPRSASPARQQESGLEQQEVPVPAERRRAHAATLADDPARHAGKRVPETAPRATSYRTGATCQRQRGRSRNVHSNDRLGRERPHAPTRRRSTSAAAGPPRGGSAPKPPTNSVSPRPGRTASRSPGTPPAAARATGGTASSETAWAASASIRRRPRGRTRSCGPARRSTTPWSWSPPPASGRRRATRSPTRRRPTRRRRRRLSCRSPARGRPGSSSPGRSPSRTRLPAGRSGTRCSSTGPRL